MDQADYVSHDATALADLVARREVSPSELLAAARARRDAVDPHLNAVVVDMAPEADARVADPDLSGPFAGVPFLLKDLAQDYAGRPTSYGCRALSRQPAEQHALVTQRFLDAGLVVFGKTNTPEFGAKAVTEPDLFGPAHNPWGLSHTPGGSSGGSGAAVAAGIVPAAGANDGGGSVRIPAACNGLVGLKLSRGLSPYGPQTGEPFLGTVTQGVVSRTVRDSAGLLDAIIGPDPTAAYRVVGPEVPFVEAIRSAPGRLRIGFSWSSAINPSVHPEAIAAVEAAASLFEELGHDDEALARDFLTLWFAQLYGAVRDAKARTGAGDRDFEADTLAVAELGRAAGLGPFFAAMNRVDDHIRALAGFHQTFDLLLTPTLAQPPVEVGSLDTSKALKGAARVIGKARAGRALLLSGMLDQLINDSLAWVPYTQLANLTGRPAISLPLHWTATGLPLGVQLVGAPGTDALLLQLAAQAEEARPWVQRYADLDPALPRPV